MHNRQLTQLHWSAQSSDYEPVTSRTVLKDTFVQDEARLQEALLEACPAELWCKGSYSAGCPRPILVGRHHQEQLQTLHEALTLAITDIVQRWWTDPNGRFPERMPLEREDEELLKWLEDQVARGNVSKFSECQGSWRPDFLVDQEVTGDEVYRITEINARFSFNGFLHEAYGQMALNESFPESSSMSELRGATDPEMMFDGLFSLFNLDEPLHLLKGAEHGIDIHMFVDAVWRRFGRKPRLITPADLRLLPNPGSESGYRLCCLSRSCDGLATPPGTWTFTATDGEIWEEIRQLGLELHQRELVALDPEMLRQISLRCFNDMRTILLVHDKRMLGIVKQEIPRLVARHVLTPGQASALDKGIVDSILPGSEELTDLLQRCRASPEIKNQYILKPIRSGKGDGIVFGEDIDGEEWVSALERLVIPKVVPGVTCVVQRRIHPIEYDLILKASMGLVKYALVGTFHVVNGRLLGLGIWRSSADRIIAVSSGGSWVCSVVEQV